MEDVWHHIPILVKYFCYRHNLQHKYDYIYDGAINGLIKAAHNYDTSFNVRFLSYAKFSIKGSMLKAVRNLAKTEETLYGNEESPYNHSDIEELLEPLTPEEKKLIHLYYFDQYQLKEISKKYKCSRQVMYHRLTKIYQKVRDYHAVSCDNS